MRAPLKTAILALAAAAAIPVGTLPLTAFRLSPTQDGLNNLHWPAGRTVMLQMQIGATVLEELIDGNNKWNDVGTTAATAWNNLADINFGVTPSGSTEAGQGNRVNNVFFSRTHYGEPFGDAIGITLQSIRRRHRHARRDRRGVRHRQSLELVPRRPADDLHRGAAL